MAWTVRSIVKQCSSPETIPFGWAYYADATTGHSYHSAMWALFQVCGDWYPKSSCGMFSCKYDNGTVFYADPNFNCPPGSSEA